jgi:hypothetical protein
MPLRKATLEVVQQTRLLIEKTTEIYNQQSELTSSPIGKHVRHIIDHFLAFRAGVTSGTIDYNLRNRETLLETSHTMALNTLNEFEDWLESTILAQQVITIISEVSVSQCESTSMTSNINRELAYLISHALHHIAYTKLLAISFGLTMPSHLGIAPATASYLRTQQAAACAQ